MGSLERVLLVPCLGTHDGVAPGVIVDTQSFRSSDDDYGELLSLSNGGVDVEVVSLFSSSNIGDDEHVVTPFSSIEDELLSAVPCRGRNGVIVFWLTDVVVFFFCHSSPLRWILFWGHSSCSSIIFFSGRGTSSPLSREKNGVCFFSFPGVFFFFFSTAGGVGFFLFHTHHYLFG